MDNPYIAPIEVPTREDSNVEGSPKVILGPAGSSVCPNCGNKINRYIIAMLLAIKKCSKCKYDISYRLHWKWQIAAIGIFTACFCVYCCILWLAMSHSLVLVNKRNRPLTILFSSASLTAITTYFGIAYINVTKGNLMAVCKDNRR